MPRLAIISILAVAAVLIGATLSSITTGENEQPASRYPTEHEARAADAACRTAGASNVGECTLWVLQTTQIDEAKFAKAAARWVRWDRAGRSDGPPQGEPATA